MSARPVETLALAAFGAAVASTVPGDGRVFAYVTQDAPGDFTPAGLLVFTLAFEAVFVVWGAWLATSQRGARSLLPLVGVLGVGGAVVALMLPAGMGFGAVVYKASLAALVVGSTVGGAVLGAVALQLVNVVANDAEASDAPALRAAGWAVLAGLVNVVAKGVFGGPVLWGAVAAAVGAGVALFTAGPGWRFGVGAVGIGAAALGLGAHAAWWSAESALAARFALPYCPDRDGSGPLSAAALAVPGVEVAIATDAARELDRLRVVEVLVVPTGGGPTPPALRAEVEAALAAVVCVDHQAEPMKPVVVGPKAAPVRLSARVVSASGLGSAALQAVVDEAARDAFAKLEREVGAEGALVLLPTTLAQGVQVVWTSRDERIVVAGAGARVGPFRAWQVPTVASVEVVGR